MGQRWRHAAQLILVPLILHWLLKVLQLLYFIVVSHQHMGEVARTRADRPADMANRAALLSVERPRFTAGHRSGGGARTGNRSEG